MWNRILKPAQRYWFFKHRGDRWYHTTFNSLDAFTTYVIQNPCLLEIHTRHIVENGTISREWIIDVDPIMSKIDCLDLCKEVALRTFYMFYRNAGKYYLSGNKSIHIWLDVDMFNIHASSSTRSKYVNILKNPFSVEHLEILKGLLKSTLSVEYSLHINDQPKTFIDCFLKTITCKEVQSKLEQYSCLLQMGGISIEEFYVTHLFPNVDCGVFTSSTRGCRVPGSYHATGEMFSEEYIYSKQIEIDLTHYQNIDEGVKFPNYFNCNTFENLDASMPLVFGRFVYCGDIQKFVQYSTQQETRPVKEKIKRKHISVGYGNNYHSDVGCISSTMTPTEVIDMMCTKIYCQLIPCIKEVAKMFISAEAGYSGNKYYNRTLWNSYFSKYYTCDKCENRSCLNIGMKVLYSSKAVSQQKNNKYYKEYESILKAKLNIYSCNKIRIHGFCPGECNIRNKINQ